MGIDLVQSKGWIEAKGTGGAKWAGSVFWQSYPEDTAAGTVSSRNISIWRHMEGSNKDT